MALPDQTRLLGGHGPPTTLGEERRTNPFLRGPEPDSACPKRWRTPTFVGDLVGTLCRQMADSTKVPTKGSAKVRKRSPGQSLIRHEPSSKDADRGRLARHRMLEPFLLRANSQDEGRAHGGHEG